MQSTRKRIMPDVFLTHYPATKFKNSLISIQLVFPLDAVTASANALFPAVLRRGTKRYTDMRLISAALDTLYGASIAYTVRKKGENQCVGFVGSFIDDTFTLDGERLLEPVTQLMGELLLAPVTRDGIFLSEYAATEQENLADAIRSVINDKREYADMRLLQEMCRGERYAVDRLGDEASLARLDAGGLYAHYQKAVASARVEIFYCGSADAARVEEALMAALSDLPRGNVVAPAVVVRCAARETVQRVTETMDVTQGKLAMGFRCASDDAAAMTLCNTMFGGSSNSKLFLNVREKLSLCYFASSIYHRSKNIVTLSSGIECANYQIAFDEIIAQLDALRRGEWEDWELDGARSTIMTAYKTMDDSISRTEEFHLGAVATDLPDTPEELMRKVAEVTPERICAAAQSMKLDSVYFLTGKEGADE